VSLVLDASVTMAWCFEADATAYTEQILDRMEQGEEAWVPALWKLEVVNALLKANRQHRVTVERAKQLRRGLS
jgi:predicted nucleic acid-binding protein